MDVDEIIKKNKLKRNNYVSDKKEVLPDKVVYLKNLISRTLITIIFVLGSLIYTKISTSNKELYQKYVLSDSLAFTKINKVFDKYLGKTDILNNKTSNVENDTSVFNSINYSNIEAYKNGFKLSVNAGDVVNVITSGIVVYNGDKDDLGSTIIIQGNDGVDIWYSNITDADIKVYDYIESGAILGVSSSDYIILTILKDGKYLTYEEYMALI